MKFDESTLYHVESGLSGERYTLYELATWKNGLAFTKIDFSETGKPVIKIAELNNGINSNTSYTNGEYCDEVALHWDDLLFSWSGNPQTSIDVFRYRLEDGWLNQHIFKVTANERLVSKDFLYYVLKCLKPFFTEIATNKQTTGLGHVTLADLKRMSLIVPERSVQNKIVTILKSIDDKIEVNNEINKNLLEQLDTRHDEFSHRKNWSTVIINDIAEKVAMGPFGSNIKVSTFVSEGVPIISGNHLRGYFLEEHSFNYITEEHAQRLKNSLVYPKDIVFTHAGNIGQVAMIPDDCRYPMYVLSQRQFYLRCDTEKAIPEYVVLFFHSKQGQHELLSYANQTGVPSIAQPATNLKKIPLKLPPIDEQRQWLQVVSPIIKLYQSNVYENEHLSSMRDSLLPKLMSGELDVSNLDL